MNPLLKKLNYKEGERALIMHAPKSYLQNVEEINFNQKPDHDKYDFIQVFVINKDEIPRNFKESEKRLNKDGKLWFCYAKKSSELNTDITRDSGWEVAEEYGYVAVRQVAIDENWSALRFKPKEEVKDLTRKKTGEGSPQKVELPPELKQILESNPHCKEFFNTLSYTNQNEYARWIASAQKQETKDRRLEKMVTNLKAGIKNPYNN